MSDAHHAFIDHPHEHTRAERRAWRKLLPRGIPGPTVFTWEFHLCYVKHLLMPCVYMRPEPEGGVMRFMHVAIPNVVDSECSFYSLGTTSRRVYEFWTDVRREAELQDPNSRLSHLVVAVITNELSFGYSAWEFPTDDEGQSLVAQAQEAYQAFIKQPLQPPKSKDIIWNRFAEKSFLLRGWIERRRIELLASLVEYKFFDDRDDITRRGQRMTIACGQENASLWARLDAMQHSTTLDLIAESVGKNIALYVENDKDPTRLTLVRHSACEVPSRPTAHAIIVNGWTHMEALFEYAGPAFEAAPPREHLRLLMAQMFDGDIDLPPPPTQPTHTTATTAPTPDAHAVAPMARPCLPSRLRKKLVSALRRAIRVLHLSDAAHD